MSFTWADIFARKAIVESLTGGLVAVAVSGALVGRFDMGALLTVGAPVAVGSQIASIFVSEEDKLGKYFGSYGPTIVHGTVAGASAIALMKIGGLLETPVGFDSTTILTLVTFGASAIAGTYIADNYLSKYEGGNNIGPTPTLEKY